MELCPMHKGQGRGTHTKMILPFVDHQEGFPSYGLGPMGYDIRLGETFRIFKHAALVDPSISLSDLENTSKMIVQHVPEGETFCVYPHTTVMVESKERLFMPDTVMAWIVGKSTYTRLGLMISATVAEPGWRGRLKFAVINPTDAQIMLHVGGGIAQLIFQQGEEPDVAYAGHYQDQLVEEDVDETDSDEVDSVQEEATDTKEGE